jgi:predicted ATPase
MANGPMHALTLHTLGGLRLVGADLTRPKPLLVLAYLALEGATPRRTLAGLFFHDAADPRDSLSTALRHLRKVGALADDGHDPCASSPIVATDVSMVLAAFDRHHYAQVLDAYAGPFLEGADDALGEEAEEWLLQTREAVAARVRTAALHLASVALSETRVSDARGYLREAVRLRGAPEFEADELRSAVHLAEQVDAPEAAQLRALAAGYGIAAASHEPRSRAGGVGRDGSLHRTTRFVGRRSELERLWRLVRSGARVVTIVGLGGVGKTRLALRFAEAAEVDPMAFPDGVSTVAFDGSPSGVDVASHVARHIGAPLAVRDLEALCDELAPSRRLLVLDNVEHVEGAASAVDVIVRRCPDVVVLMTSRRRIGLEDEYVFDLDGLDVAGDADARSDAASLFVERAVRVGYPADAAERDRAAIESLCRDLGGYPLGIELAAAWARLLSVAEIGTILRGGLDLLDDGPVDSPPRHRAVAATLAPSLALLEERDLTCLQRLSVFVGSFAFDAAVAVGSASLPMLARLVDQALVRSTGGGRGRFTLHPVLREFLREHAPGEIRRDAWVRHRRFFRDLLERGAADHTTSPAAVLDRIELDIDDITAALRSALEEAPDDAIAIARALVVDADVLQARPSGAELIALAERAADRAAEGGDLDAARGLLVKIANAQRVLLGDDRRSLDAYRRALELAERARDRHAQVMLHAIVGTALFDESPNDAMGHLDAAEQLAGDDPLLVCEVLQRRGFVATRSGDWEAVRALNERAVELTTAMLESDHPEARRVASLHFFCLYNLGGALDYAGAYEASLRIRERSLAFAEARGQRLWAAYARHEIASGFVDMGEPERAVPYLRDAYRTFRDVGAPADVALVEEHARTWRIDLGADTHEPERFTA